MSMGLGLLLEDATQFFLEDPDFFLYLLRTLIFLSSIFLSISPL